VRILIAGGGTAGHVFPAIALAERLVGDHGADVRFVGSATGQEAELVPAAGFPFYAIRAVPFYREVSLRAARAPIVAVRSLGPARPLVRAADVVVGMGGYASLPASLAARRERVPLVLHEQNAIPSLSNRLVARRARVVASTFESARASFPARVPFVVTGNPIRARIAEVSALGSALAEEAYGEFGFASDRVTVIVLGGSQGALHLDQAIAAAIHTLASRNDLQLLVLTGPAHVAVVERAASQISGGLRVHTRPFLDRMELALGVGDLAIARAGAGTIAELAACGIPMVLVPYPHATGNHQELNARELEGVGAAEVIKDRDLSGELIAERISHLVARQGLLKQMSEAARGWGKPDAARRLSEIVVGVVPR
jgi:UDP-N-acetylglucosamine--N-acetylmuramyl-(pentapeptide) pyrophosphoryl-undecaprenol N-acetylglucosamine transferase